MSKPNRSAVVAFTSLSALGLLAGCATATPQTSTPVATTPAVDSSTSSSGASTSPPVANQGGSTTAFADGTYTADGQYVAPSGPESVTVTLTLADGTVTAVDVVGHASDSQAKRHQSDFASGIAAVVVGQPIEGLSVDRVAGSSLTGQGFNAALDAIRAEADA